MVPPKTHKRFRQLVTGEFTHSFRLLPAGMCVARNLRAVRLDGSGSSLVDTAIDDVHAFFTKYEAIMGDDLKAIFG